MGSFVWFSCVIPELWSLYCQKLYPFLQFVTYISKISKAVTAIHVYAFESSRFAL